MMKAIVTGHELVKCYRAALRDATEFDLAMAMASPAGIEFLRDALRAFLDPRKKKRARFLLGIDLPTPPAAIDQLHSLAMGSRERCEFRIFRPTTSGIFHPKLAIFRTREETLLAILGSSNLTNGGLIENREANILVTDHLLASELRTWFESQFNSDHAINVDASWLDSYRAKWNPRERAFRELCNIQSELRGLPIQPQARPEFPGVAGYTVAFTGTIVGYSNREVTLYRNIRESGGEVAERAHERFDFVVAGDREGTEKWRKARREKKPILDDYVFLTAARTGRHALQEALRQATSVPQPPDANPAK